MRLRHEHLPRWIQDLKDVGIRQRGVTHQPARQARRGVTARDRSADELLRIDAGRHGADKQENYRREPTVAQHSIHDTAHFAGRYLQLTRRPREGLGRQPLQTTFSEITSSPPVSSRIPAGSQSPGYPEIVDPPGFIAAGGRAPPPWTKRSCTSPRFIGYSGGVTLRTWTFAISFIQSTTPVAHALICPDARYIAVRWQDGRLDRRRVSSSLWPALELEIARDLATEPVSRSSMISTVLVGSMGALMLVSFDAIQPVVVGRMEDATDVLDAATRFPQPV